MAHLPLRISFSRRPGSRLGQTALLVGTLALAIAANTVLFSIVNVFVLRPLPMAEPERVGFVLATDAARAGSSRRVRMDRTAEVSVTKAMMRISPPHRVQRTGRIW